MVVIWKVGWKVEFAREDEADFKSRMNVRIEYDE